MIIVPLAAVPNQSLSMRLGNDFYNLVFKIANGIMAVDIARNGVVILSGQRVVAGTPIIPYSYLESGNFIFQTNNGDLPNYLQFGITQILIFASQAELEAIRAAAA